MAVVASLTPIYKFKLINFDVATWHDEANSNWQLVDGLLNNFIALSNVQGVWANSTVYAVEDRVVDNTDSSLWECKVAHTSAASPTTFSADRAANPTYWEQVGAAAFASQGAQYAEEAEDHANIALTVVSGLRRFASAAEASATAAAASAATAAGVQDEAVQASDDIFGVFSAAANIRRTVETSETNAAASEAAALASEEEARRSELRAASVSFASVDQAEDAVADAEAAQAAAEAAQAAAEAAQTTLAGINTQTGTTYTLALSDAGKVVEMNNASANTVTVPPNSTVAFAVGDVIELVQYGAGVTTIAAGAGVTIRSANSYLDIRAQYGGAMLYKRATNEWVLVGDLA